MANARNIRAIDCEINPIHSTFSIYQHVEQNYGDHYPILRIFHIARLQDFKTFITEKIPTPPEILEEDEQLKRRTIRDDNKFVGSESHRVSFFKNKIKKVEDLGQTESDKFLGYLIAKKNIYSDGSFAYQVRESVLKPRHLENLYVHTEKKYKAKICKHNFFLKGSVYCQQNSLTTICAHSALSTLISSTRDDYIFSPHEVNKILDIKFPDRIFNEDEGLRAAEIYEVIEECGFKKFGFDDEGGFIKKVSSKYSKYLYSSIESGYPALLGFEMKKVKSRASRNNHLVPVIGHTFNQDTWVPNAEKSYFRIGRTKYYPSNIWMGSLVIHDDNFGVYYCLPQFYINADNILLFVGVLPKNIESDPLEIEPIALNLLSHFIKILRLYDLSDFRWLSRLCDFASHEQIVLRTKLQKKDEYIKSLQQSQDWHKEKCDEGFIRYCGKMLPDEFWQVEVSIPMLFAAHKRKIGEVLIRADAEVGYRPNLGNLFLLARFPYIYFTKKKTRRLAFDYDYAGLQGHIRCFI